MSNTIISQTGVIRGYGSSRYKWVSGLTAEERQAVRGGRTVLIEIPPLMQERCRARYKVVTFYNGKYGHRNYYGKGQGNE